MKNNITLKKPEDSQKILENIRKLGSNKQCFDCGEKGTTYVVMTFGTFVCSRCSGMHRELNNKVKGIGVCNFTEQELNSLNKMGNDNAKEIWLGRFDANKHKLPDPKDATSVRNFIKAKYSDKKFYVKPNDKKEISKQEDEDSDEESSGSEKKKYKKGEKKDNKVQLMKPAQNIGKLAPLNVKGNNITKTDLKFPNNQPEVKFDFLEENGNSKNKPNNQQPFDTSGFEFTDSNTSNTKNDWGNIWTDSNTNNNNGFDFVFSNETKTQVNTSNNLINNNNLNNIFNTQQANSNLIPNNNQSNVNTNNIFSTQTVNTNLPNNFPVHTNTQSPLIMSQTKSPNTNQTFDFNSVKLNNTTDLNATNTNQTRSSKNIDDLDRMLRETNLNLNNTYTNNQMPQMNQMPQINQMQQMNQMPQMNQMQNNNFIPNQQMMQQFQMMMMNPQMQQSPQMMQFMQMMMQGMGNMGYNNLQQSQSNYNMNPMGTLQQNNQSIPLNKPNNIVNDLFNSNNTIQTPIKEESNDMFKDIYNYSQQKRGSDLRNSTTTTNNPTNYYNPFDI